MKYNKGFTPILIALIVVGVIAVGGIAYYLGTTRSPYSANNDFPDLGRNNQYKDIIKSNKTSSSSMTVFSPNGGEVYKSSDKISVKWMSTGKDNVAIYLRFSDGGWCFVKDAPSNSYEYSFIPSGIKCNNERIIDNGQYKVTLISYLKGGMAPEPGTAFAGKYSDGDQGDFGIDSSDSYFTINSSTSEESTTEVFKNQPGYIKSITSKGNGLWSIAVDLVTTNPDFLPGVVGPRFLNQNTKIRNLNINSTTKIVPGCGQVFVSNDGFMKDTLKMLPNANPFYFDIKGGNISKMIESCAS